MKTRAKKYLALFAAFVMLFAMYVPSSAKETDITVSVKIRTTALNGAVLAQGSNIILPAGSTALDALKEVVGGSESSYTSEGVTYYTQGILKWRSSQYGNYLYAVAVNGHGTSTNHKYFNANGTANSKSNWSTASGYVYEYLSDLNDTESDLGYTVNSTFNNTVHEAGYLSEMDYNNYSGWMMIINGNTNNLNADTVLGNNATIDLNYSMMMGLDLGQASWMEKPNHDWVQKSAWNTYSFTNDVW